MSSLLRCAVTTLALGMLSACPSSHDPDPEDPRPPCPEEFERGNDCTEQADCEGSSCGRLGGVCVEYRWTCGQCDLCFFEQVEHLEPDMQTCNPDVGLCEE